MSNRAADDTPVWGLRGIAVAAGLYTSGHTRTHKARGKRKSKPRPAGEPDTKRASYLIKHGFLPAWRAGGRLFSFPSAIQQQLLSRGKAIRATTTEGPKQEPVSTEEVAAV
jgi:hypothetical protein